MRVEIDDKSGFCFGVVRAITEAERALGEGGTVYSLGDIVHNRIEVQRLEQLGLRTVTHAAMPHLAGCRPRRTSYDLRRRPGNEHRDHRRHLPGGRTAATPREGGPRTDAPHGRAGGDPRQTGPRRSGGPHGAGRGPDDRDRTGGGPGADRLLASGLFPFADHAEHRAVRTAGRRNAPPGRRCGAGVHRRHDLPAGIEPRTAPHGVFRTVRRRGVRLRAQVVERQGALRGVPPDQPAHAPHGSKGPRRWASAAPRRRPNG